MTWKRVVWIGVALATLNWVILPLFPAVREQRREDRILARTRRFYRWMRVPGVREHYLKSQEAAAKAARERAEAPPRVSKRQQPRDLAIELLAATTGFPSTDFTITDMAPGKKHAYRWQGVGRLERATTGDPSRRFSQRLYFRMDADRRYIEELGFYDQSGRPGNKLSDSQAQGLAATFLAKARPGRPLATIEPNVYRRPIGDERYFRWRERQGDVYTGNKGEVTVDTLWQHVTHFEEYRPPAQLIPARISLQAAQQELSRSQWQGRYGYPASDFHLYLASRSAPNEGPIWECWHDRQPSNKPAYDSCPDVYHIDAVTGRMVTANDFAADFPRNLEMPQPNYWDVARAVVGAVAEEREKKARGR